MNDELALVSGIVGKLAVVGVVLFVVYLVAMKVLVFLRALTRPARRVVRGALDPIERKAAGHVADALEEAGLRRAAKATRGLPDAAASVESSIARHLDRHSTRKD